MSAPVRPDVASECAAVARHIAAGDPLGDLPALARRITVALHGECPPEAPGEWWGWMYHWHNALAGSLGAAAALVPTGWAWSLHHGAGDADPVVEAVVYVPTPAHPARCRPLMAEAPTPARALLLALLRAYGRAAAAGHAGATGARDEAAHGGHGA